MFPNNENNGSVDNKIEEYESIFEYNNLKLHVNTAIIFADTKFNHNFDLSPMNLLLLVNLLGGGKIQIKAIGVNNEKMQKYYPK